MSKNILNLTHLLLLTSILFSTPASAEFVFKENLTGFYSNGTDGKMVDTLNQALNTRIVRWWQDVATRVVDINELPQLDTTGGYSSITVPVNPAISASDIPSRPGNIRNGAFLFKYKPGINVWSEERFTLESSALDGRNGLSEIWVQWDVFVPENYHARVVDGHWNTKHMVVYGDDYHTGISAVIQRVTDDAVGVDVEGQRSQFLTEMADGTRGTIRGYGNPPGTKPIFYRPEDIGKWVRNTVHIKAASGPGIEDGVWEFWIQHANGEIFKYIDEHAGPWWHYGGVNYFNQGYFMGWTNPGFAEETWFALTNIIITENGEKIDRNAITEAVKPKSVPTITIK